MAAGADMTGPNDARPAATVVPLRDGERGLEVLLLRRRGGGAFGGMWVFPGGQVEATDGQPGTGEAAEIARARSAAVREAHEEAGIHLDESELVTLSFWIPPPEAPRRFATWFFLAEFHRAEVLVDGAEILDHRWLSPAEAIQARDEGLIGLVPPTFTTLWWLSAHRSVRSALDAAATAPPGRFATRPAVDRGHRTPVMLWEGDAGYEDGDLTRPGPRRRLWMDSRGWRVEIRA